MLSIAPLVPAAGMAQSQVLGGGRDAVPVSDPGLDRGPHRRASARGAPALASRPAAPTSLGAAPAARLVGRAASAPRRRNRAYGGPAGPARRPARMCRDVKEMTYLWLTLAIVALAALSMVFSADSRPGVEEPPQAWFGRR